MALIKKNALLCASHTQEKVFMLIDGKTWLPDRFCIYNASMTP